MFYPYLDNYDESSVFGHALFNCFIERRNFTKQIIKMKYRRIFENSSQMSENDTQNEH